MASKMWKQTNKSTPSLTTLNLPTFPFFPYCITQHAKETSTASLLPFFFESFMRANEGL